MVSTGMVSLETMEPPERNQLIGNTIYPRIASILRDDGLAGKITGMCLELPVQEQLSLMGSEENLRHAIDQAISVLPPEMQPKHLPPSSPASVSPTSVLDMAPGASDRWADDMEMDEDELPPVCELFASAERKRTSSAEAKKAAAPVEAPSEAEAAPAPEWDAGYWATQDTEATVEMISARLQEPQLRIARAVVEMLGAATALELLARTERVQAAGGMMVEETGKPRTSGGIFFKLLKDASDLPRAEQEAAVLRIKVEGKKVKPSQKGGRVSGAGGSAPSSPAPMKLGDFVARR